MSSLISVPGWRGSTSISASSCLASALTMRMPSPLPDFGIEALGQADAFIAHRDDDAPSPARLRFTQMRAEAAFAIGMLGGVGDQFVHQQRRRNGTHRGDLDAGNDLGDDRAVCCDLVHILAEIGEIGAEIEVIRSWPSGSAADAPARSPRCGRRLPADGGAPLAVRRRRPAGAGS